jgi:hypothetical protein
MYPTAPSTVSDRPDARFVAQGGPVRIEQRVDAAFQRTDLGACSTSLIDSGIGHDSQ